MDQQGIFALVVDCDEVFARDIRATLRVERGLRAHLVASVAAARAVIVSGLEPRAFLIDVEMGDGDGLALAEELRLRFPWSPMLIQTALCSQEIVNRVNRLGARHLCKPYRAVDLDRFVDEAIKRPGLEDRLHAVITAFSLSYRLTVRQGRIVAFAVAHASTKTMAKSLGVKLSSIESAIRWILAKTGDKNIRELAERVWLLAQTEPSRAEQVASHGDAGSFAEATVERSFRSG